MLNLLFRCSHRRLTRPVAPVTKAGQPHSQSYVVCLDCGKQFEYDLKEMRIGKVIDHSKRRGRHTLNMPKPRKTGFKYAMLAALPAAVMLGAMLKGKKKARKPDDPFAGNQPSAGIHHPRSPITQPASSLASASGRSAGHPVKSRAKWADVPCAAFALLRCAE